MNLLCALPASLSFNTSIKLLSIRNLLTAALCGLLFSCGGGGGSGGSNTFQQSESSSNATSLWQAGVYKPKESFANKCAVPRTGTDPSTKLPFVDTKGTALDEKNFLRSWSNETYLWYNEIFDTNPANTTGAINYFNVLKTNAKTASGNNKDNFHFTYATSTWYDLAVSGVSAGYGIEWIRINSYPPRNVVVAYTEPGSPGDKPQLKRGAKIIKVDDVDFVYATDSTSINKINAALFPQSLNEVHTIEVQNVGSATTDKIVLQSASVTKVPVQNVKVLETPTGKVGYFLFNDHLGTAERGLYDAVNTLSSSGIKDLVLDIRYNGGGYLSIASKLAYMIAGNNIQPNQFFEKTMFNDKHTITDIFGRALTPSPFISTASDSIGGALPTLNLKRVYVITSGDTCSASESVINGLRGVDVEVIQIGSKTCGKPYGFYAEDNCGTTYFTIQLKGVNNKGFGEYSDGFVPSANDNGLDFIKGCSLGDDLTHDLGNTAEKNLATALRFRESGTCVLPTNAQVATTKLQKPSAEDDLSNVTGTLNKELGLTNRIMK